MRNWIIGWLITLRIMFFERDTYRLLRDYSDHEFVRDEFLGDDDG